LPRPLRRAGRLGGHVDDVAVDVEFPAVIEAAQAALLVATEDQRCTAMQAELGEHAQLAVRIAEDDQVFAQEPGADRRAVLLRDLVREADRQPVAAHDAAHGRVALDAAQQVVLFAGQLHVYLAS
jgi:hypothetical protein